ncbi:Hypothetical_protein [Hexamita inflata]|uniref:Hypothetical_protein n=1 Tax=Hexamita inflata TaxID=28002 RepID=A0ABP1HIZ2_9EUKA
MSRIATTPSVYSLSAEWAEFKSPAPLPDRRVIQLANYFYFSGRSTSRACVAPRELGVVVYIWKEIFFEEQHWLNNLAYQPLKALLSNFSDNALNSADLARNSSHSTILQFSQAILNRLKPLQSIYAAGTRVSFSLVNFPIPRNLRAKDLASTNLLSALASRTGPTNTSAGARRLCADNK